MWFSKFFSHYLNVTIAVLLDTLRPQQIKVAAILHAFFSSTLLWIFLRQQAFASDNIGQDLLRHVDLLGRNQSTFDKGNIENVNFKDQMYTPCTQGWSNIHLIDWFPVN